MSAIELFGNKKFSGNLLTETNTGITNSKTHINGSKNNVLYEEDYGSSFDDFLAYNRESSVKTNGAVLSGSRNNKDEIIAGIKTLLKKLQSENKGNIPLNELAETILSLSDGGKNGAFAALQLLELGIQSGEKGENIPSELLTNDIMINLDEDGTLAALQSLMNNISGGVTLNNSMKYDGTLSELFKLDSGGYDTSELWQFLGQNTSTADNKDKIPATIKWLLQNISNKDVNTNVLNEHLSDGAKGSPTAALQLLLQSMQSVEEGANVSNKNGFHNVSLSNFFSSNSDNQDISGIVKMLNQDMSASEGKEFIRKLNKFFTIDNPTSKGNTSLLNSSNSEIKKYFAGLLPSQQNLQASDKNIISQLSTLLNNNNAVSEISVSHGESTESRKILMALLQRISDSPDSTEKGKAAWNKNAYSDRNSPSVYNFSESENTRAGNGNSVGQRTLFNYAQEESKHTSPAMINDSKDSTVKHAVVKEGTSRTNVDSSEKGKADSVLHNTTNNSQMNKGGDSSGDLLQQGKNNFQFANAGKYLKNLLNNTVSFNTVDHQQNTTSLSNNTVTTLISFMEEQKASVTTQAPPGSNIRTSPNNIQQNVMEQILDNIRLLNNGGKNEIKLRLNPPELGGVKLHFTEENNEIGAKIYVENAEVKAAIQNNIQRLRDSIAFNGVEIQKFEVYVQDDNENEQKSLANFDTNNFQHHDNAQENHDEENDVGENENKTNIKTVVNTSDVSIDYIL